MPPAPSCFSSQDSDVRFRRTTEIPRDLPPGRVGCGSKASGLALLTSGWHLIHSKSQSIRYPCLSIWTGTYSSQHTNPKSQSADCWLQLYPFCIPRKPRTPSTQNKPGPAGILHGVQKRKTYRHRRDWVGQLHH